MRRIPRIIHYCWFGNNEMPELITKCISSWKRFCPEYEIIVWNDSNLPIVNAWLEETIRQKKWAFVSDYVRLYVLYKYGGIYLDTDFELIKNVDLLIEKCDNYDCITGYENDLTLSTAFLASVKGSEWIKELLRYYDNRHFINNGKMSMCPNSFIVTDISVKKYGLRIGDEEIGEVKVKIYPTDVFAPFKSKGLYNITNQTIGIHHFYGSWKSKAGIKKIRSIVVNVIKKFLPNELYIGMKCRIYAAKYGWEIKKT